MNVESANCLDDPCYQVSIASCQRPPVPGKEDDWMPSDTVRPCSRSDILPKCGSSTCLGEDLKPRNISPVQLRKAKVGFSHHRPPENVDSYLAGNHILNTNLETSNNGVPLGSEPEGSSTVSYLKWAESLDYLLQDSDGVRLFKEFLDQEHGSSSLEFWFACSGLKMVEPTDSEKILGLMKLIFKKYIKGDCLHLKSEVKRPIVECVKKNQINRNVFDEAQEEIADSMRNDSYPLFLKSDTYLRYIQTAGQESPKQSNNSSGSDAVYQSLGVGALPTLHEDEELAADDLKNISVTSMSLTPSALLATRKVREGSLAADSFGSTYPTGLSSRLPNPYHVSYATVSAQDSELQSLSSDALTDDTMSYTDSSVDGRDYGYKNKNLLRKQMKAMRRYAETNQEADLYPNQQFIPRTGRVPPDCNMSETDPTKFAELLIEKLLKVKEEQDKLERIKCSLRSIQDDADLQKLYERTSVEKSNNLNNSACNFSLASVLLASAVGNSDKEDNAQSILDDHVSHVWNSSGPTPSRSPGFQTPNCTRRDVVHLPPAGTSSALSSSLLTHKVKDGIGGGLHVPTQINSIGHHRVPHEGIQLTGIQSGHKHGSQRHSHHHGPKDLRGWHVQTGPESLEQLQFMPYHHSQMPARNSGPWVNSVTADNTKLVGNRKSIDLNNSRCAESGNDRLSHLAEQRQNNPPPFEATNERVLMWMLDNEKYCGGGGSGKNRCSTDGSDKGSSSHKRSSHKSANSSSKKGTHNKSNRSESLDRSRLNSNVTELSYGNLGVNGSTLYSRNTTDACMVPSANHSHFLDDTRHHVPDEIRTPMNKLRPVAGNYLPISRGEQHREPVFPPPTTNIPVRNVSTNHSIPINFATSFHQQLSNDLSFSSQKPESKPGKDAVTVVGYYFCDEPIPYRTTLPGCSITLGQLKQLISKKGNYRYFFKKACDEFESGVVHEEITCDSDLLPLWEGKVVCKIERIH